ncbi:MAG: hypothetical protein V4457_05980 [Pseudomonadota bacterium]
MNRFQQILQRKRLAYVHVFLGPNGRPNPEAAIVLADLKRLAGINRGGIVISPITRTVDPYATAYRAGLRDAYLRIMKFTSLEEAEEIHHDDSTGDQR